jgi:hypothetical protein
MFGPHVYPMADLLRGYLKARGKHRPIMPVRLRLTNRELPTLEAVAEHTLGWEHYLARLQAASAGGDRAGTQALTTSVGWAGPHHASSMPRSTWKVTGCRR